MNPRLERLLEKADAIWASGQSLPIDLAQELMFHGVDVEKLEKDQRR
jgi:hypothetical protein